MSPPHTFHGPTARDVFESGGYRYLILRTLADHPHYGILQLASRQHVDGGPVRLVELQPSPPGQPDASRRVEEEVRLARRLRHPNIATVYGHADQGEQTLVVREHLRGCYLLTAMDAALMVEGRLSPAFAAYVTAEVAHALDFAHGCQDEAGQPLHVVHRAVGPMHIRVGHRGRVVLTHFGTAWSALPERVRSPEEILRGDPAYMAPELFQGHLVDAPEAPRPHPGITSRADVFSLGLVLLELLTACYPLDPPDSEDPATPLRLRPGVRGEWPTFLELEVLARRVSSLDLVDAVRRMEEQLPPALGHLLAEALRPRPEERPPAGPLRDALRAYLRSLERPYGAREAGAELRALLQRASHYPEYAAFPSVERGVLALPADLRSGDVS